MELLDGMRVIDLSRYVSGPNCTMILGDLGADVIKIEHPRTGDGTRRWGMVGMGMDNPYFLSVNRSKRSVAIDIKHPEGQDLIKALAKESDVLIHNFKFGSLDAVGLGWEVLHELNPRLVLCEISGYGDSGPYRDRPAFDFPTQAQSGLMSVIGEADGTPMKVGVPILDVATSLFACNGILAALISRERTGLGTRISTSLLESALACMTNVMSDYLVGNKSPARWGNGHPNLAPYAAFKGSDGWFTIGVATEGQWINLCKVINRPDLATDERFATNQARLANRDALDDVLAPEFLKDTRTKWLDEMNASGIPCAPINTIPQIVEDPQIQAIGMIEETAHPELGSIRMVRSPISIDSATIPIHRPPPTLGQHTDEVLSGVLGIGAEKLAALRHAGTIR